MTFDEHMEHGGARLNEGHFITAWWHFRRACRRQSANCEAHQLRGVCLRLLRLRSFAGAAFAKAYRLAQTNTQRAKVLRDDSSIILAQKNYPLAIRQLKHAHKLLSSAGAPLALEVRREYWITIAYLGDAYRRAGDERRAYQIILQAWAGLCLQEMNPTNSTRWLGSLQPSVGIAGGIGFLLLSILRARVASGASRFG